MYDAGWENNMILYSEEEIYRNYLRTKNDSNDLSIVVIASFCLFFIISCYLSGILFLILFL